MAVYQDNYTAMVIFAQTQTQFGVQQANTINPVDDTPFNNPDPSTPKIPTENKNGGFTFQQAKKLVVGLGVMSAVKSVANYYKNNYGEIMQDSNAQAELNEAMNIVNMGVSIGMGFAVGGWIGGLAQIGATGVNLTLQGISRQRMLHRNDVQSQIMMARTQYASINGGR